MELVRKTMSYNKIIIVTITISLIIVLALPYVHAQILSYQLSNVTRPANSILIFGFSNSTIVSSNTTLSSPPNDCIRSGELQVHNKTASFDMIKAISLSNNNTEFKSKIEGYNSTFDSKFDIWSLNKTSCTITWNTTNLVYDLGNGTNTVKRIIVTEDPTLTQILNVTEQHLTGRFSTAVPSSNWSGYEFSGDGNIPPKTQMSDSYSTFIVPSISIPLYPSNACSGGGGWCVLATWVGLEDKEGTYPGVKLAQSGTVGNITCTSSSCIQYSTFYEFLPAPPVYCTGLNQVNAGDSITADVYNDTITGGTNTHQIDIFTIDNTNLSANVCTISKNSYFTTTPVYSSFITEGPTWATLPQFNSVQMTQNTVYYGNAYRSISQPYSNGWFNEYNFYNTTDTSITNHDPMGQNFTETWNPNCSLPSIGNWAVPATCTDNSVNSNYSLPGSVTVPNGVILRVPWSKSLTIDFSHYNLQVNSGGGVLIDGSSDPNQPTIKGGAIKCPTC